jgi:hypothetical protein
MKPGLISLAFSVLFLVAAAVAAETGTDKTGKSGDRSNLRQ